ncbi:MAG TPA: Fe-S protein assembly co-chaperone HscB [Vicinamibacterales bacterium]
MSPEPIPVRSVSTLECRNCGAGAPVDEHFCPQCNRILALGRFGDYFSFLGLPRRLGVDLQDLERRFRDLSRKFHPDYFYNASPGERLASLERSSYLNDAYRTLRNPVARIEHLLAIEGLPPARSADGTAKVPPSLLEEVFALNEELDEIRELRESGGDAEPLRGRLRAARKPIERRREQHERQMQELSVRWDAQEDAPAAEKRATLDALRERLLERNYINNLLTTIEREVALVDSGLRSSVSGHGDAPETEDRRP